MNDQERLKGLGAERVKATLRRFGTIRQCATVLTVSHTALRVFLKREGLGEAYDPRLAKQARLVKMRSHSRKNVAGLAKWLESHQEEGLPSGSLKDIARMTDCTVDQVKTYMYRKRREVREKLRTLPNLREREITLLAMDGQVVDTKDVDWYKFTLNRKNFTVMLMLTNGDRNWKVAVPKLDDFIRNVTDSSLRASL